MLSTEMTRQAMEKIKEGYFVEGIHIKDERPPVWDSVCVAFNIIPKNAIFAYGDVIYNPDAIPLAHYLIEHEKVHFRQQGFTPEGAALWWGKYLRDPQFRVSQEVEAYGVQYREMCKLTKDRNQRYKILFNLAEQLSGKLYAEAISHADAMKKIKSYVL